MDKQKQFGQYFTTNIELLSNLHNLIRNNNGTILEPSFGQGHIIKYLREHNVDREIVGVEIDDSIKTLIVEDEITHLYIKDFLTFQSNVLFSTIVGNPPYFKLKDNPNKNTILKTTNIYIAFIEKAFHLLADGGEILFIIPSDFFKLTSASKLKELMLANGSFTDVYHPHKENLFEKATQDVIIFRYQKGLSSKMISYNGVEKEVILSKGNIYFKDAECEVEQVRLEDIFDIKVGMVSGAEKIFANETLGNINIYTASGYKKQIMIDQMPANEDNSVYMHLMQYRDQLQNRKIKKFNDNNWFQWGCLRNKKFMEDKKGKICIYSKVLTRSPCVFSIGNVDYYDGSLLCIYPRCEMQTDALKKILDHLNSKSFLQHFLYSGRYKIGQKTLANAYIPKCI